VIAALLFTWLQGADFYFDLHRMPLQNGLPTKRILGLRMCGQTPDRETSLTRPSMKPSARNQSALNIFLTSNTSFPTTTKILDLFK